MADTPEVFLDEFIAAFVQGDAAALKALYRDDARLISPAAGVDAHGRAEIDAAWDTLVQAGTVHRFEVLSREVTVTGNYAICHMRSVLHGRWEAPTRMSRSRCAPPRSFDAATTDSGVTSSTTARNRQHGGNRHDQRSRNVKNEVWVA